MNMTRRQIFALSAGAATYGLFAFAPSRAFASVEATEQALAAFTGGTEPKTGTISLTAPEIAENGNTVPISVTVESPMTEDSYVESVTILAEGNPNPEVATFHFTPMSGSATATTRIRLAQTQNVIAVAKMNDGSVFSDRKEVKVTIGGCGG
ncbi:thiosulfate oxidation carrier protein SoxY [Aurantimonas endophytica]|uniref:Sulfur-oxidizing protein SoxY n=1 Tax=Aurantimonas endophytica TaxID=1522175 RepID=A0A7W6HF70_9HYPH|nr:thiosulfate oxidation carrier protein SoxY [Aurantimonas endophytica]MBB4004073.1 sulfur-oxidizing protein SoxY [Aurantimonas endophytica]MCO6404919.1 thiosulfate oxidation carrier protein SoxY [Aurantimonas endophytica]